MRGIESVPGGVDILRHFGRQSKETGSLFFHFDNRDAMTGMFKELGFVQIERVLWAVVQML